MFSDKMIRHNRETWNKLVPLALLVGVLDLVGCNREPASSETSSVSSSVNGMAAQEWGATQFGVAIAAPAYNPNGIRGPGLVLQAAEDMRMLGYKAVKLWLNAEVMHPRTSTIDPKVRPTTECSSGCTSQPEAGKINNPVDLLRTREYSRILDLDFSTFVFFPDSNPSWINQVSLKPFRTNKASGNNS